jgi:hypothetical protein
VEYASINYKDHACILHASPGLFDVVKVSESPKYTKLRFCLIELKHNAKGF